jgi:diguanylate cyclase (GGDEF)-like protein/PAS domain S-box-containing protein
MAEIDSLGARLRGGMRARSRDRGLPELHRAERRRAALLGLNQRALQGVDLDELLAEAMKLARAELALERCEIWEREAHSGELVLRASTGDIHSAAVEIRESIPGPAPGLGVIAGGARDRLGYDSDEKLFFRGLAHMLGAAVQRERALERLESTEAKYRRLIERLPVVTYLAEYGETGRWLYVSPQIEDLLGYTPEEWMADPGLWIRCVHPDDREAVAAEEDRCAAGGHPLALEYRMYARDGRMVWVRDDAAIGSWDAAGPVAVEGVLADVTLAKTAEAELRHRADHDDLTGLINRRRFEEELAARRAARGAAGAVAFIDVDSLKFINDSLGHAAGDALLCGVVAALERTKTDDEVLARFGGDEFALLMPIGDEEAAVRRASDFVRAVRARESQLQVTASAGVVTFDRDTSSADADLVVAADIALHEAKERGGDRVAAFTGADGERLAWVGRVRQAIDEDRLLLHSQPIIDLASGDMVAEELLVRMIGVDGETLPPATFLPTAERFGLIREIDKWVIGRAIDLVRAGKSVTINVSARSIASTEFINWIARIIERANVDPSRIVFEITETGAVTAIEELSEFGERVKLMGCALAIDDFGTGFGSLTYLKHLPIRYLKIDMEFVRGIAASESDRAIVTSIVTIAESLGMRTVAEGVENARTAEILRESGVDLAQGFHLGRPAPVALATG